MGQVLNHQVILAFSKHDRLSLASGEFLKHHLGKLAHLEVLQQRLLQTHAGFLVFPQLLLVAVEDSVQQAIIQHFLHNFGVRFGEQTTFGIEDFGHIK